MTTSALAGRDRALCLCLTWLAYASYYVGRLTFSVTKVSVSQDLEITIETLASVDTAYLGCYAIGQFISGHVGDRVGSRRLVGCGMLLSAVACTLFGVSHGARLLLVAACLNGLAQSTGLPGTTKAVAAWTTAADRGRIVGLWTTCYHVGSMAATALAAYLLGSFGWRVAFVIPAFWLALVGLFVVLFLPEAPPPDPGAPKEADPSALSAECRRVSRSATVWCYGACCFFVKLIRYSLLFWLPYYLYTALHMNMERAGYLSICFAAGSVAGSVVVGSVSDRVRGLPRSAWTSLSLVGLAGTLCLYARLNPSSTVTNIILLSLVGALVGSTLATLSSAVQEIGGRHAVATANGICDGVGSVGALVQGGVTLGLTRTFGWDGMLYSFVVLAIVAASVLIPTFRPPRDPSVKPLVPPLPAP